MLGEDSPKPGDSMGASQQGQVTFVGSRLLTVCAGFYGDASS